MNDTTGREMPGEARAAIVSYLRRKDGHRMVTTSDAISHLRGSFPSLATSDRSLTDIVAGAAIAVGLDVELDGEPGREAQFDRWQGKAANSNRRP
jgi:hypothetical protein